MRQTSSGEILSEVYSARIEAVEALIAAGAAPSAANVTTLAASAEALTKAAARYGNAPTGDLYHTFGELVKIAGLLGDWQVAIRDAAADADRFLRAAKERAQALKTNGSIPALLKDLPEKIETISTTAQAKEFIGQLAEVPLPVGLYYVAPDEPKGRRTKHEDEDIQKAKLAVAFLEFTVDGRPLTEVHYMAPMQIHDLDLTVRVSRWPNKAERLVLRPVSVVSAAFYQLPTFEFLAPGGDGPHKFEAHSHATLTMPQSILARPLEFKYTAEFEPRETEQPVEVVGQRTLRLEAIDWERNPQTGYTNIDRKLIAIRDQLRGMAGVPEEDIAEALKVAVSLGKLAGQAVQDNRFPQPLKERDFQMETLRHLRSDPPIGSTLQEHPRAGGGITDLSFKGLPIELKAETDQTLQLQDCQSYVEQSQAYAVANGRRLGILCVLDTSPKQAPPFPAEEGIGLLFRNQTDRRVPIITPLIQGNLTRPSKFSV